MSIESLERIGHSLLKHVVGKESLAVGHTRHNRTAHSLAHRCTCHLSRIMTAHAVAQHEQPVAVLLLAMSRKKAVLLMWVTVGIDTFAKLPDAICF